MKKYFILFLIIPQLLYSTPLTMLEPTSVIEKNINAYNILKQEIINKYSGAKPTIFSSWLPDIKRGIRTEKKIIAFTFDACGGKYGNRYDSKLISFLSENNIPATLFISSLWIDANLKTFMELANNPLFEIENHGFKHKPCSVSGFSKYGIKGTSGIGELVDEIELNARKIYQLTGKRTNFFRPATGYCDDIALKIVYELKHIPVNFNCFSGDSIRNISGSKIEQNMLRSVRNGSIVIFHMNHPGKNLSLSFEKIIPILKKNGYTFVKLSDHKNMLY